MITGYFMFNKSTNDFRVCVAGSMEVNVVIFYVRTVFFKLFSQKAFLQQQKIAAKILCSQNKAYFCNIDY
jgi:hypothetical protein